jgi:hypothetical protein
MVNAMQVNSGEEALSLIFKSERTAKVFIIFLS